MLRSRLIKDIWPDLIDEHAILNPAPVLEVLRNVHAQVARQPLRAGIALAVILFCWPALVGPAAAEEKAPLTAVSNVDLNRYLGTWYEIASYPAWFQKGCTGSTADYSLLPDGRIRVINRCYKESLDGPEKESTGKAEVVDKTTNAKLKVWFFWPFKGDYWIIDLDPDYQWAVVGVPSRKYLWILCRSPSMDAAVYQGIIKRLIDKEYDPTLLRLTPQPN